MLLTVAQVLQSQERRVVSVFRVQYIMIFSPTFQVIRMAGPLHQQPDQVWFLWKRDRYDLFFSTSDGQPFCTWNQCYWGSHAVQKKLTLDLFSWFYQAQLWMVWVAHNSIFHLTERKLKGAAYDLCYCSVVLQQVCWTSTGLRPSPSTAWSSCASTTPTSACSSTTSLTSSRTFRSAQSAVLCTTINTFKSTLKTHLFSLCQSD